MDHQLYVHICRIRFYLDCLPRFKQQYWKFLKCRRRTKIVPLSKTGKQLLKNCGYHQITKWVWELHMRLLEQYIAVYSSICSTRHGQKSSINLAPGTLGGCAPRITRRTSAVSVLVATAATLERTTPMALRPASAFNHAILIYPRACLGELYLEERNKKK